MWIYVCASPRGYISLRTLTGTGLGRRPRSKLVSWEDRWGGRCAHVEPRRNSGALDTGCEEILGKPQPTYLATAFPLCLCDTLMAFSLHKPKGLFRYKIKLQMLRQNRVCTHVGTHVWKLEGPRQGSTAPGHRDTHILKCTYSVSHNLPR